MQQLNLFEETLQRKIERLEKWMGRLQKQMVAAQEDIYILKHIPQVNPSKIKYRQQKISQIDMFTGS